MFSTSSSFIFLTGQGVHSTKTVMTTTGDDIQSTTGSEVDGNVGGGSEGILFLKDLASTLDIVFLNFTPFFPSSSLVGTSHLQYGLHL